MQYLEAHFNEAPMTYLVRKELDSGEILDRFTASDEQAGIRKINGWAKMAVKLDGGKILQYSNVIDGVRYTLLQLAP
jgi:hypothetical protein